MGSATTILTNLTSLGFNSASQAASNARIAQGIGDFIDNILTEFTNTQNSILNVINTQRYGKSAYYTGVAKTFQYGYDLVPSDSNLDPGYAIIDPTAQIISQAAFVNNQGALSLKVATANAATGQLGPLSASQLSAFISYFVEFQIPGLPVAVISLAGNVFSFSSICTFNAGYNLTNLQANVQAALLSFASTFSFNGVLYSDQVSDYIKANVPGVIDFFLTNTQVDGAAFVGSTTLTAGYFTFAPTVTSGSAITYNPING